MEELVIEFTKIFVLLFKYLTRIGHSTKELYKFSVQVANKGELVTYGECIAKFREICPSDKILVMIDDLEPRLKPIENLTFEYGYTNSKELSLLEYKLNNVMLKTVLRLIDNDTTLKNASKFTGIPENTIKHACQQERLMNVYKAGSGWIVNLNEIEEYWDCKSNL